MHQFPVRIPAHLAPLLVGFRKQAGYTQREVALRMGVTQQTYSALERAPETASLGRLLNLLNILGVALVLEDKAAVKTVASTPAPPVSDPDTPIW